MRQARRDGDTGAAAVEFALVSVLLFTLLFGIIGFGFALFKKNSATHAAREGARIAAVGIASGSSYPNCMLFAEEVIDRGRGANITGVTVDFPEGNEVDAVVVVSVSYSVDLTLAGAFIPGIPDSLDLTETGEARIERKSTGDAEGGCS